MVKWIVLSVVVFIILVTGGWFGMSYVSFNNQEIELRNLAKAQQENNKTVYDKVWKVIKQKAGVTDKYANDFKEAYGGLMTARYGDGKNPMWSWVKEHNPNLDVSMYKDLSRSIEALRNEFQQVQKRLIDIKREHDNLRQKIPSSWFVGGREELVLDIVTSKQTKQVFKTGEENDVDLF
jgi:Tfp pilus assembly protein PilO